MFSRRVHAALPDSPAELPIRYNAGVGKSVMPADRIAPPNRKENGSKGIMRQNVRPTICPNVGLAPVAETTLVPVTNLASVFPHRASWGM